MMAMRTGTTSPVDTPYPPRYAGMREDPAGFAPISGGSSGSGLKRPRRAARDAAERAVEGIRRPEARAKANLVDGPVGRDEQALGVGDAQADHVLPDADAA